MRWNLQMNTRFGGGYHLGWRARCDYFTGYSGLLDFKNLIVEELAGFRFIVLARAFAGNVRSRPTLCFRND